MRVMSIDLNSAFARIAEQRDKLNVLDSELSAIVEHVESALVALKTPVPSEMCFANSEGKSRWLRFNKHNNVWRFTLSLDEHMKGTALDEVPRHLRAEIFQPLPEGPTPLEAFILEIAASIESVIRARQPLVERARALSKAIEALGYPRP